MHLCENVFRKSSLDLLSTAEYEPKSFAIPYAILYNKSIAICVAILKTSIAITAIFATLAILVLLLNTNVAWPLLPLSKSSPSSGSSLSVTTM